MRKPSSDKVAAVAFVCSVFIGGVAYGIAAVGDQIVFVTGSHLVQRAHNLIAVHAIGD